MTTDDTCCPACGILYINHPGLIPTCRELLEARADRDRYKAALAESCDNMRAEGPYEGMGICPQLQEVTAERDRYREALIEVKYDDEATQCLSSHARLHLTEALKEEP